MKVDKFHKLLIITNAFLLLVFIVGNLFTGMAMAKFYSINAEMTELTLGLEEQSVYQELRVGCLEACSVDKALASFNYTSSDSVYCRAACGFIG